MKDTDGNMIPPSNKKFHIEFGTATRWKNGEIIEDAKLRLAGNANSA